MDTIFIQIASYRDEELPRTLADCLAKASHPDRLRFGICWQRDETETLDAFSYDRRFRICAVNWRDAQGVGWARNICNALYRGEDFTLQIDAHHRFAPGWDEDVIRQWHSCKDELAILSGYPPGFKYTADGSETLEPGFVSMLVGKAFESGFIPTYYGRPIPAARLTDGPPRVCATAAGFLFARGSVCEQVPYAREVYFGGEEFLHSARLFSHGYHVYAPLHWMLWHLYHPRRPKSHWNDFQNEAALKANYSYLIGRSVRFLREVLLEGKHHSRLFGPRATLADFERYCGLSPRERVMHPAQFEAAAPPFELAEDWEEPIQPKRTHLVRLELEAPALPDRSKIKFYCILLQDRHDHLLRRVDITSENVSGGGLLCVDETIESRWPVHTCLIFPYSQEGRWLQHTTMTLTSPATPAAAQSVLVA